MNMFSLIIFACLAIRVSAGAISAPLAATLMGVNAHTAESEGVIDELHAYGVSWIRDDIMWGPMETEPGVYNFTSWEYTMDRIRENDMGIIAILNPQNPLYDGGDPVRTPEGMAAMGRWAAALAKRWSNTTRIWWECTNEPNGNSEYQNATLYAQLVRALGTAIHAADPDALVVGPASENIGITTGWLRAIFEQHNEALQHFDRVTIHPYRSDGPETVAPDLARVSDLLAEYAPPWKTPMPFSNGEWGYGAGNVGGADELARLFVRQQLITTSVTGEASIWYQACVPSDQGIMKCTNGGAPFTPLPAMLAGQVMHNILRNDGGKPGTPVDPDKGFRFVRRLPIFQNGMSTSDDWLLLFRSNDGGVLLVAWTSTEFEHITRIPGVEPGACFTQTSMSGDAMPNLCHDPRGLHVNMTTSPRYLLKQR